MLSVESICTRLGIETVDTVDDVLVVLKRDFESYWKKGILTEGFLREAFDPERLVRHGIFCDDPLNRRVLDGLPEDQLFQMSGQSLECFVLRGFVVQDIPQAHGFYFGQASAEVRKGVGVFHGGASGVVVGDSLGYGYDDSHVDGRDQASVFLEDRATGSFSGESTGFCLNQATGYGFDRACLVGQNDSRLILRNEVAATCMGNCFFEAFQSATLNALEGSFGITYGASVSFSGFASQWVVGVGQAPCYGDRPLDVPVVDLDWAPLQDLSKWRSRYADNQSLLAALKEALRPQELNSRAHRRTR